MDGSHGFAAGRLTKAALMCLPSTYEDSMPIINRVREEMSSEIVTEKPVALKENSKIILMSKIGDKIDIDDPLIIFEEVGDSAKSALDELEKMSNSSGNEHLGRNVIKSKYAGEIVNIKVYYNCNLDSETIEPSLASLVKKYIKSVSDRHTLLKGIKEDELIELPSIDKIQSDKILGNEMSGVLVVFYIQHVEDGSVGAKYTFFSACKGIVSEVIDDDKAPTSEARKDKVIEAFISPMSLISRNVPDLLLTGYSNKVILELKFQCLEALGLYKS